MTPSSNEATGLQQSLGYGRYSSIHFFFNRNDPILCQGIKLIPWLSLSGEMPFTKVCVTAPYELFIVYCLYLQINIRIKFKRRGGKGAQESQK